LRQRLGAAETVAKEHPDADTLTAYVEQLLPATERETVSTHLATCGDCREILALSQPELPEAVAQPVIKPVAVPAWRRFFTPGFGLAGMVGAMAVIAVVLLQSPQKPAPQPVQQAQQTAPAAPSQADQDRTAAASPAAPAQTAQVQPSRQPSTSDSGQANGFVNRNEAASAASVPVVRMAPAQRTVLPSRNEVTVQATRASLLAPAMKKQDYVNTNLFTGSSEPVVTAENADIAQLAPTTRSRATGMFQARSDSPTAFADIPPNAGPKSSLGLLTPIPPPEHFTSVLSKLAKNTAHGLHLHPGTSSSPAIRSSILGNSAMGSPGMFSSSLQKDQLSAAAAPDKAEAGSLEKSEAFSGGTLSTYNARVANSQWKVADGKLLKMSDQLDWRDAHPVIDGSFEFSCVTARGGDVWAGGTHGTLIHSRDGGTTWETIKLGEAAASSTVTNISILSSAVQVKTSDNQLWLSVDGGKSWLAQNQN